MIFATDDTIDVSMKNEKVLKYKLIEDVIGKFSCNDVLEIGCGAGTIIRTLAKKFHNKNFTGYDIDENAITLAQSNTASNLIFTHSRESLKNYDAIILIDVLEHHQDPVGLINDVYSMTKENCILLIHVPLERSGIYSINKLRMIKSIYSGHVAFYKISDVMRMIDTRFDVIYTKYHYHFISGLRDFLKYYTLYRKDVNKNDIDKFYTKNWHRYSAVPGIFKLLDFMSYYESLLLSPTSLFSSGVTLLLRRS